MLFQQSCAGSGAAAINMRRSEQEHLSFNSFLLADLFKSLRVEGAISEFTRCASQYSGLCVLPAIL